MKRVARFAGSIGIAITLFFSGRIALADVTPPASCASTAVVGDACTTSNDEKGVCVAIGSCAIDDAGKSPSGCLSCEPGIANDAGNDGGTTTTTTTSSSSSGGCSASPDAREGGIGLIMLALGFLSLAVSRKKRP